MINGLELNNNIICMIGGTRVYCITINDNPRVNNAIMIIILIGPINE